MLFRLLSVLFSPFFRPRHLDVGPGEVLEIGPYGLRVVKESDQ